MYRVKWKFSQRAHECRSWVLRWVSYYRPSLYIDFSLYIHLQSNPVFRYGQHCNIVTQYCNIDRLIALANCNRHEQIESWNSQTICKQSLWLDYKKEGSTNPVAQTIWLASLFLIIQSEALFTNLLWISTCNLFVSVAICWSNQPFNIAILRDNIAMLPATEHRIWL